MTPDTTLPATLTAVHVALAVFRRHRARPRGLASPFVLPSFFFIATPWIWAAPMALAIGAVVHLIWVGICELLAPKSMRAPASQSIKVSHTAPTPRAQPPAVSAPRFVTTTVLAVVDETPDIRLFRFARPDGFDFVPGQFIAVRTQIDGRPHVRCYSLCSPSTASGYLEIAVRRQGIVSSTLHATLQPGAAVTIGRPAGTFVYPSADDRPIALLAGGVGITPLLAMLRHAVATEPGRSIVLLYSSRTERDIAFAGELRLIAERHPHVRIGVTLSRASADSPYRSGRIDADLLRQYVRHPTHTVFCLCGPAEMIGGLSTLLGTMGVPAAQIRSERFETAAAAVSLQGESALAAAAPGGGGGYRISFAASGRTGVAARGCSLLEAAETAGVAIASSCRAGVCQSCRTRLVSGEADCRSEMLDPDDRRAGFILPCVSWPTTDCVLDT